MRFFIYDLIDPRDNSVFYVGKGQGNRPKNHTYEAIRGKRGAKCDRIRDILAAGHSVKVSIISRHEDEIDAYIAEASRVDGIGLHNLTNIIPGGLGGITRPFRWTEALVKMLMPRISRAFGRVFRPGNDGRMYVIGIDVTEAILSIIRAMMADLGGPEKFYAIWYRYGCA